MKNFRGNLVKKLAKLYYDYLAALDAFLSLPWYETIPDENFDKMEQF